MLKIFTMKPNKEAPSFKNVSINEFSQSQEKNLYFKFKSNLFNEVIYVFKNGSDIELFPLPDIVIYFEDEFEFLRETLDKAQIEEAKGKLKKLHQIKKLFRGRIMPEASRSYADPASGFSSYGDSEYWARLNLFAYQQQNKSFADAIAEIRKRGFYFKINEDNSLQLKYPPGISEEGKKFFKAKYLLPYKELLNQAIYSIQGKIHGRE